VSSLRRRRGSVVAAPPASTCSPSCAVAEEPIAMAPALLAGLGAEEQLRVLWESGMFV
jgi:hypothetical protein